MAASTQWAIVVRTSTRTALLYGAALGAGFTLAAAAHAEDQKAADCVQRCAHPVHHKRRVAPKGPSASELAAEVDALKAQVAALEQRLDASTAAAQQAQASAQQAQASAEAAQSAAQNDQLAINQIPGEVQGAIAALPKPANDGWWFKDVKFTPGGFIAAESAYRSRGLIADGATSPSFVNIPYDNTATKAAHTAEWRPSARQSRVIGLAEANPTPDIKLTAYGEFDFLGAAQTANSNESNSYNLRIRNVYTTVDMKEEGLSVLAGQNWTLATLNNNGITPRSEVIPTTIDAQYTVGFVWNRQPQFRVTENFGNGLWVALSAEGSQTNSIGGQAALLPGVGSVVFNQLAGSGSLFNSANAYSFNHVPDVIGKIAYDGKVAGHHLHVEGFGLYRNFYDRVGTGCTTTGTGSSAVTNCTAFHNADSTGGGGGFGVVAQVVPGLFDAQVSGLFGEGLGRYGTSQFSDVFETADGSLAGIREQLLLAGLLFHPTPTFDLYGYIGEERAFSSSYMTGKAEGGYGNPAFSNLGGCEIPAVQLACNGNTELTWEATLGFWQRAFTGDYGSFRLGLQYSYVKRVSFSGEVDPEPLTFGRVSGADNLVFTSIRYYPFQK